MRDIMNAAVMNGRLVYVPVLAHYFVCTDPFDDDCLLATLDGFADEDDIESEIDNTNAIWEAAGFNVRMVLVDIYAHDNLEMAWNYQGESDDGELEDTYLVPGFINLFYMRLDSTSQHAYFPWSDRSIVVLNKDYIHDGWSLGHELGHWWGLLHSFEESEYASLKERVTRDPNSSCFNCWFRGDSLCDTPAAINLGFGNPAEIVLTGTCDEDECSCSFAYDPVPNDYCGVPYEMSSTVYLNLMQYGSRWCSKQLTAQQVDRMWKWLPYRLVNDLIVHIADPDHLYWCAPSLTLPSNYIDNGQRIEIDGPIMSHEQIQTIRNTLYDSGDKVVLKAGFKVFQGSSFRAVTEGCLGNIQ
jgi:hypothetical protein